MCIDNYMHLYVNIYLECSRIKNIFLNKTENMQIIHKNHTIKFNNIKNKNFNHQHTTRGKGAGEVLTVYFPPSDIFSVQPHPFPGGISGAACDLWKLILGNEMWQQCSCHLTYLKDIISGDFPPFLCAAASSDHTEELNDPESSMTA